MPSPEAAALTRRFQAEVLRVAAMLALRIKRAAMRADTSDIDAWWEQVSPQIRQEITVGQSATARLARQYLRQHAAIEGLQLAPVEVEALPEQIATALRVTGPVAFKTHMAATGHEEAAVRTMATRLEGATTRLVLQGSRNTTMQTFAQRDQLVGWRRVGSSPCAFCAMLISRGAVYDKDSADFHAHDHDRCSPEPLYRREPEPPEVRKLAEQWDEVTAGTTGKASVDAWRAHWDAQTAAKTAGHAADTAAAAAE